MNERNSRNTPNTAPSHQAIEAEMATLGSMLLGRTAIDKASAILAAGDFSFGNHAVLFSIITEMHSRGELADATTVMGPLESRSPLKGAEALQFLGRLTDMGLPPEVEYYARKVRDAADRRRFHKTLANAQGILRDSETFEGAFNQVERLFEELRIRQHKSHGPATISASALMTLELPAPKWAVPSIVPEGLTILFSKPKIGKSWFAYQLGIAIASGGVALGSVAVEQGEVLLLMLEDTKRRAQRRIGQLLDNEAAPDALYVATEWPRMDDGGRAQLEGWLKAHPKCRLVVIDTLEKFRARRSERGNAYGEDYQALGDIKAIADRFGVSIIVIHHERKSKGDDLADSASGSAGVTGAADGMLRIKRERGNASATLEITGRDVEEAEYGMRFDSRTAWLLMGEAEQYHRTNEEREVIDLITRLQRSVQPKEVADLLELNRSTAKSRLWRMAERNLLTVSSDGWYSIPHTQKSQFAATGETLQPCNPATGFTDAEDAQVAPVAAVAPIGPIPEELAIPANAPPEEAELRQKCFRLAWAKCWPSFWLDNANQTQPAADYWREFCTTGFLAWVEKALTHLERLP